jgi:hypothetical protein
MRRILLVALLITACKTEYEKGVEALQLENPAEAMKHFQKVARKDVAYIAARNQIGRYWYALAFNAYTSSDMENARKYASQVPESSSSALDASFILKMSEPIPVGYTFNQSDTVNRDDSIGDAEKAKILGIIDWIHIKCRGKTDRAQDYVCSDTRLLQLDISVADAYEEAQGNALALDIMNTGKSEYGKELESNHREWLQELHRCQDPECLERTYANRLLFLKEKASSLKSTKPL